jgi:hypothetical protein
LALTELVAGIQNIFPVIRKPASFSQCGLCAMMPSETGGTMSAKVTPEVADELTTEVIHFLQRKYPAIDTATAMETLFREWNGADEGSTIVPIKLKRYSATLERLQDWSERKGLRSGRSSIQGSH